jgi:hypothetical protein
LDIANDGTGFKQFCSYIIAGQVETKIFYRLYVPIHNVGIGPIYIDKKKEETISSHLSIRP